MLINNTNREHTTWGEDQLEASKDFGEIVDMIMPGIPAEADEAEADRIAGLVVRRILRRLGRENAGTGNEQDAVICQGDFTLVYRVVTRLKEAGVTVVAPSFQRVTKPTLRPDGTTVPGYSFRFERYRQY
ncbi:MAG: hypothetical protein IJM25_00270 [Eubacterium sp.]|nr:hypothetical protein [Eubacterium sp.]